MSQSFTVEEAALHRGRGWSVTEIGYTGQVGAAGELERECHAALGVRPKVVFDVATGEARIGNR